MGGLGVVRAARRPAADRHQGGAHQRLALFVLERGVRKSDAGDPGGGDQQRLLQRRERLRLLGRLVAQAAGRHGADALADPPRTPVEEGVEEGVAEGFVEPFLPVAVHEWLLSATASVWPARRQASRTLRRAVAQIGILVLWKDGRIDRWNAAKSTCRAASTGPPPSRRAFSAAPQRLSR